MARSGAPVPPGDSRGDRGPGPNRDRKSGAGQTGYAWDDHLDSWDRPPARPPRRSTASTHRSATVGGRPASSRPPTGTRRVSAPVSKPSDRSGESRPGASDRRAPRPAADRRSQRSAAGRRAPRPVAAEPVVAWPDQAGTGPSAFDGDLTIAPPPGGRRVARSPVRAPRHTPRVTARGHHPRNATGRCRATNGRASVPIGSRCGP